MDFLIEEKTLELALLEAEKDIFLNESVLMSMAKETLVMESTKLKGFAEKTKEIIKKVLDALVKFFKDVGMQIEIKFKQAELQRKLDELKDIMAKKKAKNLNSQISIFDIQKYKKYYSDFIDRYTAEYIKGMNKEYNSVEEYEAWRTDMLNKLADFNFKMSDEEQWKLSVTINSAIKLTEEEAKTREETLKMVDKKGSNAIKGIEKYYKTIDTEHSFVNYNGKQIKIFSLQNSTTGLVVSKIGTAIQKVTKFIFKNLFAIIGIIIASIILL